MTHTSVVQSILAQHTFACGLVTCGAICDCCPPLVKPDLMTALAASRVGSRTGTPGQ